MASVKTVTTATAQKTKKHEINRGKGNYVREQPSASREPVVRRYSYLQKSESLKVPEEVQVPNRVVNEEGEAEVEERNCFCLLYTSYITLSALPVSVCCSGGSVPEIFSHLHIVQFAHHCHSSFYKKVLNRLVSLFRLEQR